MMMKKMIAGAALVATLSGVAAPALANTDTDNETTTVQTTTATEAEATIQTTTATEAEATETTTATEADTTVEAELPQVSLTPDQFFYFLKLWVEQIELALTRDAAARAVLLEEQAQVRLAEAVKLAEEGKAELAQRAMEEAQAKLADASSQIDKAVEAGADLQKLVTKIESDEVKFATAVRKIVEEMDESVTVEMEPLTADLLVQLATTADAARQDETAAEEAEEAAEDSDLAEELAHLEPRKVLVLKAMAEAAETDLAEVYALYQENPGLGRIAKQLGLKMGPVQHAAQIEWMKWKADQEQDGEEATEEATQQANPIFSIEIETDDQDDDEDEDRDEDRDDDQDEDKDDDQDDRKEKKEKSKRSEKWTEHPGAKGLERARQAIEKAHGKDKR